MTKSDMARTLADARCNVAEIAAALAWTPWHVYRALRQPNPTPEQRVRFERRLNRVASAWVAVA